MNLPASFGARKAFTIVGLWQTEPLRACDAAGQLMLQSPCLKPVLEDGARFRFSIWHSWCVAGNRAVVDEACPVSTFQDHTLRG